MWDYPQSTCRCKYCLSSIWYQSKMFMLIWLTLIASSCIWNQATLHVVLFQASTMMQRLSWLKIMQEISFSCNIVQRVRLRTFWTTLVFEKLRCYCIKNKPFQNGSLFTWHKILVHMLNSKFWLLKLIKGPLSYKYILTSVDVYESIHHKIITC